MSNRPLTAEEARAMFTAIDEVKAHDVRAPMGDKYGEQARKLMQLVHLLPEPGDDTQLVNATQDLVAAALRELGEERDDWMKKARMLACEEDAWNETGGQERLEALTAELAELKARRCEGCEHFEGPRQVTSYELGGTEEPTEFTQKPRCHKHQRPVEDPHTDFCSLWEAKR